MNIEDLKKTLEGTDSTQNEIIRDKILAPAFQQDPLQDTFLGLFLTFFDLSNQFNPSQNYLSLRNHIQVSITQADQEQLKFFGCLNLLIWGLVNGDREGIKENFIQSLAEVKYDSVFSTSNQEELNSLFNLFRLLFPDIKPLLRHFEALISHQDFLKKSITDQKGVLLWIFPVLWRTYNHSIEFLSLIPALTAIYNKCLNLSSWELALFLHFQISNFIHCLTQTQEHWGSLNTLLEVPLFNFFKKNFPSSLRSRQLTNPIKKAKIAIVYDRVCFNAPFKVLFSLLTGLIENDISRQNLFIYDYDLNEKGFSDSQAIKEIKKLGVNYISVHELSADIKASLSNYHQHTEKHLKLRHRIEKDGIDVLLLGGTRSICNFLFTSRTAPLQIFFSQGHYTYDLPEGIDGRITMAHVFKTQEKNFCGYLFQTYRNGLFKGFIAPHTNQGEIEKIRSLFPKGSIILGNIGRGNKADNPAYQRIILETLKQFPQTGFLACGDEADGSIKKLLEILNKEIKVNNLHQRYFFLPPGNPHVYGHAIDIFLNTFPHSHGTSLWEYMAKKKPVVSMTLGEWSELNDFIPASCQASSEEDYKQLLHSLILDSQKRSQLAQDCLVKGSFHLDVKAAAQDFIEAIEVIADKKKIRK